MIKTTEKSLTLQQIYYPVAGELDRVKLELSGRLTSCRSIPDSIRSYLLSFQGKYLRPALILFCTKSIGSKITQDVIRLSAAVELLQTASLIHDDIIDCASHRRGKESINLRWGSETALLVGDCLFSEAFSLLSELKQPEISLLLSEVAKKMCGSEITQLHRKNDLSITENEYIDIVEKKTASLFSACCQASAILAKSNEDKTKEFQEYGRNFGIGYQIIDDCSDIINGTAFGVTLPVIYMTSSLDTEQKKNLSVTLLRDRYETLSKQVKEGGYLSRALKKAKFYMDNAKRNIEWLDDSRYKKSLLELTEIFAKTAK